MGSRGRIQPQARGQSLDGAEVEQLALRGRDAAERFTGLSTAGEARHDVPARGVPGEGRENDRAGADEKAGGRDSPGPEHRVEMP